MSDGDFDASDSDVVLKGDESTDETEGSSGDESSEINSSEDENSSDNDQIVSSKKAKPSSNEPQEVKNGRALVMEYAESLRDNFKGKVFKWTKQL